MPLGTNQQTITTGNVFRPNIWTKELLVARESNLVLVPLVKRYDRDIRSAGQTVEIPNVSHVSANAKVANTQVTLNAPTEVKDTITIDQHWEASVLIEDMLEIQAAYDLARAYTARCGYAIAEKMDSFVAEEMSDNFTQEVGTYGTALSYATILSAKQTLDEAKAPLSDRHLVVTPKGHTDLLNVDEFTRYDAMGAGGKQASPFLNGRVGYILGFPVYMSQNLVETAGSPTEHNNLFFHREAFALAVQQNPKFERQRKTEYLGDLIVCSALWGGVVLRTDHGIVVKA